jgi:hypothetical protein
MSFNLNMIATATISADAVKALIKEAVEQETGKKVARIDFKTRDDGDYADRHSSIVFDGCTVTFSEERIKPVKFMSSGPIHRSGLASQIESVERGGGQGDR